MAKEKGNNNILMIIIIILLLIIIAGGAFFFGKTMNTNSGANNGSNPLSVNASDVEITIISDTRCGEQCDTAQLLTQLKQIPSLAANVPTQLDYSDDAAKKMLESAGVDKLPAAIFSNNSIAELTQFLTPTADQKYSLQLGATYDPTVKRSDKGFMILDTKELEEIKKGAFIKGNKEAPVTWIEYSDLECPFCAKLHTAGTPGELTEKYGDKLNQAFQHFPLDFHKNALPGAQLLECLGKEKGTDAFYTVMEASFKTGNSSLSFLVDEAVKVGGDKEALEKCVSDGTYSAKVQKQMSTGTAKFGVTGTPGNVLINNATGEYEVISGAYPTDSFVTIIDRLLK